MKFKKIILAALMIGAFSLTSCDFTEFMNQFNQQQQGGNSQQQAQDQYEIVLNKTEIKLNMKGQLTDTLEGQVKQNGQIINGIINFKANDLTVASFSAGKVTAKKQGTTSITASYTVNDTVVASKDCSVVVLNATPTYTGINISKQTVELDINGQKEEIIHAEVLGTNAPSQEVKFSNPNTSIVSLEKLNSSDYKVTAKAMGSVALTVSVSNATSIKKTCNVSVIDSAPVKVTLNETSKTLGIGRTFQLNATVEHTLNKSVTWKSSNTNVTVTSSGLVTVSESAVVGSTAKITATSKEDNNATASCTFTITEKPKYDYDYTIMFYMCASTLEDDESYLAQYGTSEIGLFSLDIREILSVSLPSTVKILIETGGTKQWYLESSYLDGATSISSSKLQRWEVSNGKLKLVQSLSTNQMASESSFESFLDWGLTNYNAEQMGVVLSGHGGGIAGCAYDDNYTSSGNPNTLNASEVATAAGAALQKADREKFTWIGYDCCLMSCADIASVNSDYFDYMVASQESEAGTGWNHDAYLKLLQTDSKCAPETLLPKICQSFLAENHKTYESQKCLQTLATYDLRNMNTLVSAFDTYVTDLNITSSNQYKVVNAFKNSYNVFGDSLYGLCDFTSLLTQLDNQFGKNSSAVKSAINNIIIENSYCSKYTTLPCGMNAFYPLALGSGYPLQARKADYSGSLATKFTAWQTMCLNNWASKSL